MRTQCSVCGAGLPIAVWLSDREACDPCLRRREAARQQGLQEYRAAVLRALSDLVITPQEWAVLDDLRVKLRVAASDAFQVHRQAFQAGYEHVLQDRTVTPQEMRYLQQLQQQLRLPESAVSPQLSEALRLYQFHQLQTGPLPVITPAPLALQRGEVCHWLEPDSSYIEEKTERVRVSGSHGVSVRIAKGVTYRVGASRGYSYPVTYNAVADVGTLAITSKRLAFMGSRRSFSIAYPKLLTYNVFENAIQVQRDGLTAKPQAFTTQNEEAAAIVLARAIDHAIR